MTRKRTLNQIKKFISMDSNLNFEERLVLLRAMADVEHKINRRQDNLDTILLRLRYGVKQRVPLGWSKVVTVPSEVEMNKEFVKRPAPKGEILKEISGGLKQRPEKPKGVKLAVL